MREMWSRERKLEELAKIEADMRKLLSEADGCYSTDHGQPPNALTQAAHRFKEAVMWANLWIDADR